MQIRVRGKSNTTTEAVYAELGRTSLKSHCHVTILKFYNRLCKLESERYASRAYQSFSNDANEEISKVRSLQTEYGSDSDNSANIKMKV